MYTGLHRGHTERAALDLNAGEGEMVRESDGLVHASVWHMHGYEGGARGISETLITTTHLEVHVSA